MASFSETGHAKNIALFKALLIICKGLGTRYKPAPKRLQLETITPQAEEAETLQAALNKTIAPRTTAVAQKDKAFEGLSKRITRSLSAFKSCKPLPGELQSAQTIAKTIKGENGKKKKGDKTKSEATEPKAEEANQAGKERSNSRMSEDTRVENLNRLIETFSSSGVYATNEEDITLAALTQYAATLKQLTEAVTVAEQPESDARKLRDEALYKEKTGIVDVGQDIKDYIKSAFGASSPEYKAVTRIQFKRPKKD
jgi:hypothetical protein